MSRDLHIFESHPEHVLFQIFDEFIIKAVSLTSFVLGNGRTKISHDKKKHKRKSLHKYYKNEKESMIKNEKFKFFILLERNLQLLVAKMFTT